MQCHTSAVQEASIGSLNTLGLFPSMLSRGSFIFKHFIASKSFRIGELVVKFSVFHSDTCNTEG